MAFPTFALWATLIWVAGWWFFPISRRIFGNILPDGGLAVGRVLFLAAWTLGAFWVGYAGVPTRISAFGWLPLALLGIGLALRDGAALHDEIRARKRAIIASETLFLLVFLGFFVLRGFWSDLDGTNGEKSMDGALIASLIRAQELPPPNPFAAGAKLKSYYYFGHLETALLTQAVGGSMRWTYNLMCATIPALCFSTLFSLGTALTGRLRGGTFVAGAVLTLGTLQPIMQWLSMGGYHPQKFGANTPLGLDHFATSRVIPFSINEYPWFTFHQADLHGHYLAFPLALAAMCLAYALFRGSKLALVPAILVLGALILTNTWDFPVYGLLIGIASLFAGNSRADYASLALRGKQIRWLVLLGRALFIFIAALLVASPYLLNLKTAATPPQPLAQPASPLREWLLLWGPMALAWGAFLGYSLWESRFQRAILLVLGAWLLFIALGNDWAEPSGVVLILIISFLIWVWHARKTRGDERFLHLLAFCGLIALLWAETTWAGFLGSADNPNFDDYKRQDTVFKFGLQTWMLWGTAASCGAYLTLRKWPLWLKTAFVPLLGVMLFASTSVVFGRTRNFSHWDGWDGWAHLAPPEKQAAWWLLKNTPPRHNLLEAEALAGGDYTPLPRYAPATGIPTVIGPRAHSFQWSPANSGDAGQEWAEVSARKAEARAIYLSATESEMRRLLERYQVRYVVFGELERQEYGDAALERLRRSLKPEMQFGAANDPRRVLIFSTRSPQRSAQRNTKNF
ncbi:MAG: hypothetical protein KY445_02685 [Armatimonadetes bacterium]|nr:hypothetical protein [Armatimonadota bacterium]